jgi:hypothetical protein
MSRRSREFRAPDACNEPERFQHDAASILKRRRTKNTCFDELSMDGKLLMLKRMNDTFTALTGRKAAAHATSS